MTLQLLRSTTGKLRGLALLFKGVRIKAGAPKDAPWRICDHCKANAAIVFCLSDSEYICESCIPAHSMPGFCRYLSIRAAREVSDAAMREHSPVTAISKGDESWQHRQ